MVTNDESDPLFRQLPCDHQLRLVRKVAVFLAPVHQNDYGSHTMLRESMWHGFPFINFNKRLRSYIPTLVSRWHSLPTSYRIAWERGGARVFPRTDRRFHRRRETRLSVHLWSGLVRSRSSYPVLRPPNRFGPSPSS